MNQTIITGNLTADIKAREISPRSIPARSSGASGGQHVCNFTIACNEGDRVIFLPVEAWNMRHLPECIGKGSSVLLAGALRQNSWETESGEKRSRIVLTAQRVDFLRTNTTGAEPALSASTPGDTSPGAEAAAAAPAAAQRGRRANGAAAPAGARGGPSHRG